MPPFSIAGKRSLEVKLEPDLDLTRKHVLRGNQGREDCSKVRVVRIGVVLIATEVVVVSQVERLESELDANAFGDLGALQDRRIKLESLVAADL